MVRGFTFARPWVAALLLAGLILAAYGTSVRNELVFDDLYLMRNDTRVRDFSQVPRLLTEPLWGSRPEPGKWEIHHYYRPLQVFPMSVSQALFGEAAWPLHVFSLVFHFLNCLLVRALIAHVVGNASIALAAAALFAVHPAPSEAVFWASDHAGLGAALCILTVVWLHVTDRLARWYGWLLAPVIFLCGLWFKESGILTLPLLVAYDLFVAPDRGVGRSFRKCWRYFLLVPPFAVYFALRNYALGGTLPGMDLVPLTGVEMILSGVALLPQYVATFLWPFDLNMYHDFETESAVLHPRFLGGATILTGGVLLMVATVRDRPAISYGVFWSLLTVAPHLMVRWPRLNVYAERYLYLPSVGGYLALASVIALCGPLIRRNRLRTPIAGALAGTLVLFIVIDLQRAPDWHNEITLYRKTIRQSARADLIRNNLSVALNERKLYDEGIEVLQPLLAIDPDWLDPWYNLGLLKMGKGDRIGAIAAFETSAEKNVRREGSLLNLGYLYDLEGRRDDALRAYFRLVALNPTHSDAWFNLGIIALELQEKENARRAFANVLAVKADDRPTKFLLARMAATTAPSDEREDPATAVRCEAARQLAEAKEYDQAEVDLHVAAWRDEQSPLPFQYLTNVAVLRGQPRRAVQYLREALRRDPNNPLYHRNLKSLEASVSSAPAAN